MSYYEDMLDALDAEEWQNGSDADDGYDDDADD